MAPASKHVPCPGLNTFRPRFMGLAHKKNPPGMNPGGEF